MAGRKKLTPKQESQRRTALGNLTRRQCSVCEHPARVEIELMMAHGASRRAAAKRWPELKGDAIYRHWRLHVSDRVKQVHTLKILRPGADPNALDAFAEQESIGLLGHLERIRSALYTAFDAKSSTNDAFGLARVAAQLHANLRLTAEKTGELERHSHTQINNLVLAPDYLGLRAKLIEVLRQYPDAALAVAEVFREIEGKAQGEAGPRMIEHDG